MLNMNLVPLLLRRLTDYSLDKSTICKIGNVLVELLKNIPGKNDLRRYSHCDVCSFLCLCSYFAILIFIMCSFEL